MSLWNRPALRNSINTFRLKCEKFQLYWFCMYVLFLSDKAWYACEVLKLAAVHLNTLGTNCWTGQKDDPVKWYRRRMLEKLVLNVCSNHRVTVLKQIVQGETDRLCIHAIIVEHTDNTTWAIRRILYAAAAGDLPSENTKYAMYIARFDRCSFAARSL